MLIAPAVIVSLVAMSCPPGVHICTALPSDGFAGWADCQAARDDLREAKPEIVAVCIDRRGASVGRDFD